MDNKKKRKYDTVPEIYMSGKASSRFFRPHYPIEDSDYEDIAITEEETVSEASGNFSSYNGNMLG